MNRPAALPTRDEVHHAITAITESLGKPPSTLALAKHLGLANTTFRRQFPDIAADLNRIRSAEPGPENVQHSSPYQELKQHNAKLRRDIEELTMHLELAAPTSNDSPLRTTAYCVSATKPLASHPSPALDSAEHRDHDGAR